MTRQSTKHVERSALDLLVAEAWPYPALSVKVIEASEAPDFVLTLADGQRLGVEITALTDNMLAATEGGLDRQTSAVEAALKDASIAAEVFLHSKGVMAAQLSPRCRATNTTRIIALVAEHLDEARPRQRYMYRDLRDRGITGMDWIRVDSASELWVDAGCSDASFGKSWLITEALDRKNPKALEYQTKAAECWLVLVVDGTFAGGLQPRTIGVSLEESRFQKVFLVNLRRGTAMELDADRGTRAVV